MISLAGARAVVLLGTVGAALGLLFGPFRQRRFLAFSQSDAARLTIIAGLLVLLAPTSSDIRRLLTFWVIAGGFVFHGAIVNPKIKPEDFYDPSWWEENPVAASFSILPLLPFFLAAVFVFVPKL